MSDNFTKEVCDQLRHYVYRLIDPRDGQTFYIGKGQDNRVFSHVNTEAKLKDDDGNELDDKLTVIREIKNAGLEPIHVIHRHGMSKEIAQEVEAANDRCHAGTGEQTGWLQIQ